MPRYSKSASEQVEKAMRKRKKGTLRSGRSNKKVTSRKQAIAIGLSEARSKGAKVPRKKATAKRTTKSGAKRSIKAGAKRMTKARARPNSKRK